MITKLATFRGITPKGEPLVQLFRPDEKGILKVAGGIMPSIMEWMKSYEPKPNELVVLVNAMGSSEYWGQNINGDIFYEDALLHDCRTHPSDQHPYDDFTGKTLPPYGYWTFYNAHPFVHHRNKDPNRAFGRVAFATWNPKMHRVELIVIIDKKLAMEHGAQGIVDRILAGEFPDVSMGCRVPYDVCTLCGHKSKTRDDYCNCIKLVGMGRIMDDGRQIGVINLHPRFFDISFVFIGADKTAKVMCKLASGLWVPASVAEADEVYNIPTDEHGLIKAACGAKNCHECSKGCVVKEASGIGSSVSRLLPYTDDVVYLAMRINNIRKATKKRGKEKRAWDEEAPNSFFFGGRETGTGIPARHIIARGASIDGRSTGAIHEGLTEPSGSEILLSRPDDQEGESREAITDGTLKTNLNVGSLEDRETESYKTPKVAQVKRANGDEEGGSTPPMERVKHFLEVHPNPTDDELHEWSEGHGFNVHEVEQLAYQLATAHVKEGSDESADLEDLFERAKHIKIGPPPARNRAEFPFVGTINFQGLTIHIENAPGDVREGTDKGGKKWRTEMKLPYGEIVGSLGSDGDKVDVYVGPYRNAPNAHIIHQQEARGPNAGDYDEDKVMLGFDTPEQAKAAYLAHYDSPNYFRSITTMAFPLFKRVIEGKEVRGEKVATIAEALQKTAAYLHLVELGLEKKAASLDELFQGASTAQRRQRSWKDATTGKEVRVTGSGIRKEASAAHHAAVQKLAEVLHNGWSPEDLLKVSNSPKTASHLKWADIVKEIGPSKAVGRVSPLLSESEPDLPKETLEEMGQHEDLEDSLATPSLMGMVLKPAEFQRMMLTRLGQGPLADGLEQAGEVFGPSKEEVAPCGPLTSGHLDSHILRLLLSALTGKSYLGPIARKRIIQIVIRKPSPSPEAKEVDSPLLSKVSGAYTWYRREQMKLASEIPGALSRHPELRAGVYGLQDADLFKSAGLAPAQAAMVLGSVPLSLMYSAHKRSQMSEGVPVGTIGGLVAEHPWITAMGVAAGLRELLKTPQGRRAADALFEAAAKVWKKAPEALQVAGRA